MSSGWSAPRSAADMLEGEGGGRSEERRRRSEEEEGRTPRGRRPERAPRAWSREDAGLFGGRRGVCA
ncbi:unnamed protein product, partial [Prorocentrum cordatum]